MPAFQCREIRGQDTWGNCHLRFKIISFRKKCGILYTASGEGGAWVFNDIHSTECHTSHSGLNSSLCRVLQSSKGRDQLIGLKVSIFLSSCATDSSISGSTNCSGLLGTRGSQGRYTSGCQSSSEGNPMRSKIFAQFVRLRFSTEVKHTTKHL